MDFPKRILLNNGAWAKGKLELRPDFFENMVKGQSPEALWIGCSDSRVPAEEITGLQPGELFVHRNVANLFTESDDSAMSVLQYAVEALKVPYVILCGHQGCGGVTAAATNAAAGTLQRWLEPISTLRVPDSESMSDEEKAKAYIRVNVEEGIRRLSQTQVIQNAWSKSDGNGPTLLGLLYNTFEGRLEEQVRISPSGDMSIANPENPTIDVRVSS